MLKIAKKYTDHFNPDNADGILGKLFFSMMVTLPHVLTCLILIILYPEYWAGILIVGLVLPDSYFFLHLFFRNIFESQRESPYGVINLSMKTIFHIIIFVICIILIINEEYVISLSGIIHVLIDILGF